MAPPNEREIIHQPILLDETTIGELLSGVPRPPDRVADHVEHEVPDEEVAEQVRQSTEQLHIP